MNKFSKLALAYEQGRTARREGERRAHNPYAEEGAADGSAGAWWDGWDDEDQEMSKDEEEPN